MQRASTAVLVLLLGATLTTGPAAAQRAETVRIGAGAAATDAFVVYPISTSAAAVIVTHDWWGLNDQVRTVARRLAGEGYVAIVPDLFHGRVTDDAEEAHALMQGIPTDRANADLDATVAWLRANPRVGNRPIGVMGFGMGGSVALFFGLHSSALSGIVVFDGPPETDPVQLGALHSPVMAHFGAKNNGIPETRVAAFRDAGRNAEVYVYPAAARGFMNDARPSYQPDAARQAWARTLTFLQKQLRDSK
jgi:carboxymethylenebutenolidase